MKTPLVTSIIVLAPFMANAQSPLRDAEFFGRLADARAEAMGRGSVALSGDVRNMFFNPAALVELEGSDTYFHRATPWYLFERSTFDQAALGYRISKRLAVGVVYRRAELKSDLLTFGDMIDPRRGFVYNESGMFGPSEQLSVIGAFRINKGLSFGMVLAGIPLSGAPPKMYGNAGALQVFHLNTKSGVVRSIRIAASGQNFGASEELPIASYIPAQPLPVLVRAGAACTNAWRKGWLHDSLTTFTVTAQVQYDDDLAQRYRSSVHGGVEVLIMDLLALRAGWYRETVDDHGLPEHNKSALEEFTYGIGLNVPVGAFTKGRIPITVGVDYTTLPQASYSTSDLDPFTDGSWEKFQSIGIRVNYGIGRLFKANAAN